MPCRQRSGSYPGTEPQALTFLASDFPRIYRWVASCPGDLVAAKTGICSQGAGSMVDKTGDVEQPARRRTTGPRRPA
jgi:hypothetical protein